MVVLGDSVAAGEGTLSGYVYRDRVLFPGWRVVGSPARAGPIRPRCGRTDGAYGVHVARALGAEVVNRACSGATFGRGVVLDAGYDRARPDLVLVTAGANSVEFERAFAYCVLAARGVGDDEAAALVSAASPAAALDIALRRAARRLLDGTSRRAAPGCTAATPGAYLEATVLARIPAVGRGAGELADAIRARGLAAGRVPEVVVTTYPDPLPRSAVPFARCPDGAGLGPAQVTFMRAMVARMNAALRDALADRPGVRVADPDPAFAGHRWCDPDPWVHGPSILFGDPGSLAPFHPTAAGQRAIADAVLAALGRGPGVI